MLPEEEAIISRDGDRLILEPFRKKGLLNLLATWEPLDEEFLEIDDTLVKPEDIF